MGEILVSPSARFAKSARQSSRELYRSRWRSSGIRIEKRKAESFDSANQNGFYSNDLLIVECSPGLRPGDAFSAIRSTFLCPYERYLLLTGVLVAKKDRNRRRRWHTKCVQAMKDGLISAGCMAWLALLGEQSSDTAKPVWGYQVNQAANIHRSERMVRHYRAEAERAGLIETHRGAVIRGHDGRFCREHTNKYVLIVPPAKRPPAQEKPSSDRAVMSSRLNQHSTSVDGTFRREYKHLGVDITQEPFERDPNFRQRFTEARSNLVGGAKCRS